MLDEQYGSRASAAALKARYLQRLRFPWRHVIVGVRYMTDILSTDQDNFSIIHKACDEIICIQNVDGPVGLGTPIKYVYEKLFIHHEPS
jgi:hypothetical protein